MSVYNTAYETTACANFRMERTVEAIKEARLRDWLPHTDSVLRIEATTGASSAIPAFNHPLYIGAHDLNILKSSPDQQLEAFLAVDVRPTGRYDSIQGRFNVTNSTAYMGRMYRAALTGIWLTQGPNAVRSITPMAMGVYATWVAEAIGFRYNLDPKARYDLTILAAIFYASNHVDGAEFEKSQENRQIAGIANALKFNITDVEVAYNNVKLISSVEDFCGKVKSYLNNVRMVDFNAGVFLAIMYSTWFGDNSKENVAVALEHPPTWISLLFEAFTNTMMKKTAIARICERRQYKDGLEQMVRTLRTLAPGVSKL